MQRETHAYTIRGEADPAAWSRLIQEASDIGLQVWPEFNGADPDPVPLLNAVNFRDFALSEGFARGTALPAWRSLTCLYERDLRFAPAAGYDCVCLVFRKVVPELIEGRTVLRAERDLGAPSLRNLVDNIRHGILMKRARDPRDFLGRGCSFGTLEFPG